MRGHPSVAMGNDCNDDDNMLTPLVEADETLVSEVVDSLSRESIIPPRAPFSGGAVPLITRAVTRQ